VSLVHPWRSCCARNRGQRRSISAAPPIPNVVCDQRDGCATEETEFASLSGIASRLGSCCRGSGDRLPNQPRQAPALARSRAGFNPERSARSRRPRHPRELRLDRLAWEFLDAGDLRQSSDCIHVRHESCEGAMADAASPGGFLRVRRGLAPCHRAGLNIMHCRGAAVTGAFLNRRFPEVMVLNGASTPRRGD